MADRPRSASRARAGCDCGDLYRGRLRPNRAREGRWAAHDANRRGRGNRAATKMPRPRAPGREISLREAERKPQPTPHLRCISARLSARDLVGGLSA